MTERWPSAGLDIDHINGIVSDNRWCNLRLAERSQNLMNRAKTSANTSGLKGVSFMQDRGEYRASIGIGGQHANLGDYATAEEAHAAYVKAARRLHGEFARTE
jgi:hypothetical protein